MSIRIIDSCALSVNMVTAKGAETRILTDGSTQWKEVSKHCIDNKKYLIVTPCVNDGYNKANIPSDENWKKLIYNTCKYLQSIGANKYNSKISLINEPTKFFRDSGGGVARLAHFINLAYPIIKEFDYRVGAGNMEFYDAVVLGDWYRYICINADFDDLDGHYQGSCDSKEKTKKYSDYHKGLCELYNKTPDLTEAFYGNIATSSGWNLLNIQYNHAKRIGCPNFGNVFNDLRVNMFPILSDPKVLAKWTELAFKVNGVPRSGYWIQWKTKIDSEGPVPNIPIFEEDDMKLERFYYRNRPVSNIKDDPKGYGIMFLRKCFGLFHSNVFDEALEAKVRQYQIDNNLLVDGKVGPETFGNMILIQDFYKNYCWVHSLWARGFTY